VQPTGASSFVLASEGSVLAANIGLTSGTVAGQFSFPLVGYVSDMTYGQIGGQTQLFVSSAFVTSAISTPSLVRGRIQAFTTSGKPLQVWTTPHIVAGLAFDTATQTIYFTSGDSPEVYSVSVSSKEGPKFVTEVRGASKLGAVAVDSGRAVLYLSDVDSGSIFSVDLKTNKTATLTRVGTPQALALASDGSVLMVADSARKQVVSLNVASSKVIANPVTAVGSFKAPSGLAWWDVGHLIVADQQTGTLSLVEVASGKVLFSVPLK
jgi:hypothetical protein